MTSLTVRNDSKPRVNCFACNQVPKIAQKCSRCEVAIYCGTDCQTTHWPVHGTQCRPISNDGSASSASLSGAAESVRAAIPKLSQPSPEEMNILYEKLLLRKGITQNEAQSFLVFYQNAEQGD